MSNNFRQFKRKARIHSIASSILIGTSVGLALTSVLTFLDKIVGREAKTVYFLFGIGVALVVSAALYFILMPSDRRLAARLDKLYSLGEKISTMIEFSGNDGDFYRIQREDAEERLGEQSQKQMKSRALVTGAISILVCIGILIGSLVMPVMVKTDEEYEEPIDQFDKDWILASLGELIVTVQNSFMEDELKSATLVELRDLVAFVEGSNLMSEMKTKAIKTVSAIDSLLDKTNTAVTIGEKLALSSDLKVADFGAHLKNLSATDAQQTLSDLGSAVVAYDAASRATVAGEMDSLIDESGVLASDSLHQMIRMLTSAMATGSAGATRAAFEEAGGQIFYIVQLQNVNGYTGGYVITEICNLFGITDDDLEGENIEVNIPNNDSSNLGPDAGGGGGDDNDDKENPIGPGGLGTGDVIYGSNDMIFDPDQNKYVPYGDVLNEYFAKVNEMITDGKTSEEIAELAEHYYGLLFGSQNQN